MAKKQVDVLDQVTKLLALAGDKGASENEAANALAAARRLMLKYNISESSVEGNKKAKNGAQKLNVSRPEGSARFQDWELNLAVIIAHFFDARVTFRHDKTVVTFYGFDADGQIAEYAYGQVLRKIWDLALAHVRKHQENMRASGYKGDMRRLPPGQSLRDVRNSYIVGVVVSLNTRLDAEKAKDTSEETAMVLYRGERVEQFINEEVKPNKKELGMPDVKNGKAFYQGIEDGKTITIVSGIEKQDQEALSA